MKPTACKIAVARSGITMVMASTALVFTVPMVRLFLESKLGGVTSMPEALAGGVERLVGDAWPLLSPYIGGIGAAIAGSNTVSNMMFSQLQYDVGARLGIDPTWVVALQAVGGAAGNMICVHNVVAASAVVGMNGKEGAVIRKTLIPFFFYALLAGSVGYAIVWNSRKGPINAGTVLIAAQLALLIVTCFLNRRPLA